jgi:gliding motility-associated-like protein
LKYFFIFFVLFFSFTKLIAQNCNGSFGDPIINFTFGAGNNPGAPLSAATTAYQFVTNDCPVDGNYTVRNNTNNCFSNSWHTLNNDHTGDVNGYFMLVNASNQPSAFYIDTVRGLCGNSTYEFAAWITNVFLSTSGACGGNSRQPNVTFTIEKTDGTVLQTENTNNIVPTATSIWNRYRLIFTTPIAVSDVVLRITNNAFGGCGNDLALDDITFRACSPSINSNIIGSTDPLVSSHCEGAVKTYNFNCVLSAGFTNPSFQWQQSFNNIPFTDIIGQNNLALSKTFLANASQGLYKYRLAVAETGNLNSAQCRTVSKEISITIKPKLATTASSNNNCKNKPLKLMATGGNDYSWSGPNNFTSNIAEPIITNALAINEGKYYVVVKDNEGCENVDSVTVVLNPSPTAAINFKDSSICLGKEIKIIASGGNNYEWIPATFLNNANINDPITKPINDIDYKVVVSNSFNCTDTNYVTIKIIKIPNIDAGENIVTVANKRIQLLGKINGDYESYQWSPNEFINSINVLNPVVTTPINKKYFFTIIAKKGCGIITDSVEINLFNKIYIPNSFTPNADNKNDYWNIAALEAYPNHTLTIFNRYGQIVFDRKQNFKGWDGKFNGIPQPTGVYTYFINLKNGTALLKGTLLLFR